MRRSLAFRSPPQPVITALVAGRPSTICSSSPNNLPPTSTNINNEATTTFTTLLHQYCSPSEATDIVVTVSESKPTTGRGRGLFMESNHQATPATILFKVPLDLCLVVDYTEQQDDNANVDVGGVHLPSQGQWPRVRKGLGTDKPLEWDIILALALLDAVAGDGGQFWEEYATAVLPSPPQLTLPVCLSEDLLQDLQHQDIVDRALQQKRRLRELFPGLAVPMLDSVDDTTTTYLEWAFSCVRSRAFRLGQNIFAFVPFLDIANHADCPNANFQVPVDRQSVNCVSVRDIKCVEEITISYNGITAPSKISTTSTGSTTEGERGYTNQRWMAQYGFVPRQGNPFDRIDFSSCVLPSSPHVLLSVDAFQSILGDGDDMVDVFSGRNIFFYAALKSFPLAVTESETAPMEQQLEVAASMLACVQREKQEQWKSSVEEDEVELLRLEQEHGSSNSRREAVVRYRLHRKKLLSAAEKLLTAFTLSATTTTTST